MKQKFWAFKQLSGKKGELYLYGEIASSTWFDDEVTPKTFKADLDALGDIDTLDVFINSPGGDVFAGWALINILKRHKATTTGHNDGLVASIAFDIFQSMDKRMASETSIFMTHNCWTFAMGDRNALRKLADEMEKIDGMMAETTSKKSGKTIEEIKAIQDAETWYTAAEAVDAKFADELEQGEAIAACLTPEFFAKYKHPPEALHPPRAEPDQAPTAETGGILLPAVDDDTKPYIPAKAAADNGGESQPVSDKLPDLTDQRKHFIATKRKLLEVINNG
jgi:ATP-dependent Clp protease protease subunit